MSNLISTNSFYILRIILVNRYKNPDQAAFDVFERCFQLKTNGSRCQNCMFYCNDLLYKRFMIFSFYYNTKVYCKG